ncbi:glycosyltransferase family 2 protein [Bacillus atrophaeus]|uniref:glycosyltransferase family 2 protein n=1 Tax=Bacillus atrophaeus TaxID=1452 RepID=UPI002E1FF712|nr:glycosyltransferase family 2 protein [Bacillus atrophaeus]
MKQGLISIIIPSYNKGNNVKLIHESLKKEFKSIHYDYEIFYINDGSKDDTLQQIKNLTQICDRVKYISFSRNFGKEAAILAGFEHVQGEAVIVMDADLQHPTHLLHEFIKGYEEGYDQVIAQRNRKGDNPVRSALSSLYYKFINKAVEVDLRDGVGDFRLLSRQAVDSLLKLSEGNRFSKGLFCWIGFDQKIVFYENVERKNGTSKWSFSNLFNYGMDGVVSFNNKPLRICFYTGIFILLLSIVYIISTFVKIMTNGVAVPGYFTIISAVLFLGGIQLLSLGIIGEYIGRIYYETKKRPHYLIQEANIPNGDQNETN